MSTSGQESHISQLLHPAIQQFIKTHESSDVQALSLQFDSIEGIPFARIAEQIAGRQKARLKLPQYYATDSILYPPAVNLQQCSSERTARFKADLVSSAGIPKYQSCADLTGGFGVDSFYLSSHFERLHFVEPDAQLLSLARHNHQCLGIRNISYYNTDAGSFLRNANEHLDLIYLDPSRRPGSGKVIELTNYVPDVRTMIPSILERTRHVLLKASPMLDIQRGLQVLPHVKNVIVVAVSNEVRELLFFCDREHSGEPLLEAAELMKDTTSGFSFYRTEEQASTVVHKDLRRYLYEPSASILKAGAFKLTALRFGLDKLHRNTHLYTSDEFIENFPGRVFEIEAVAGRMTPELKRYFVDGKANVIVRNYPLSADQLKVKSGLRDGGDNYLIGLTSMKGKIIAAARRLI
ncbi:MAG TPA: class I SAM-dependent methyltransferase [Cyclobacteriaceae bacterium]|nr:class I SAM-dependent methyltransferase [Cyclobacteriaceae bacterium]